LSKDSEAGRQLGLYEWHAQEINDWAEAVRNYSYLEFIERFRPIKEKLERHSRESHDLYFAQTGAIGLAMPGGYIVLDISVAAKPEAVRAFWLAHEWGHHVLGHGSNLAVNGSQNIFSLFNTKKEDEADRYAGCFLATAGYELEPVLEAIRSMPDSTDMTHSASDVRAMNVAEAYRSNCTFTLAPNGVETSMRVYNPSPFVAWVSVDNLRAVPIQAYLFQEGRVPPGVRQVCVWVPETGYRNCLPVSCQAGSRTDVSLNMF
jgi:hypothetical protein